MLRDEPVGSALAFRSESPYPDRMYAIAFDLDTARLAEHYPGASSNNGYGEIRGVLESHGFSWMQGSVYYGDENVTAVTCVLAVQDVARQLSWFEPSVRDIRMLRIEENDDLRQALPAPTLFTSA